MNTLLAILATGAGTYFSRSLFILALANRRIPPMLRRALEYVGPAVLGALVVTMLITPEGGVALGPAELLALACAAAVARITRNHVYTLLAGMGLFWLLRTFL
jgi:branched-subunit amino acid transport protein